MESYKIVPGQGGWSISHNNSKAAGGYATREGAFEAACLAATNAIKTGAEISINVAAPASGEAAIGGPAQNR